MNLRRILKLLGAFLMSQGVSVVTQLLVPPIFLHRYPHGVEMYGEWMALTAAATYLTTLNSGIQSYGNNQMTLHYGRGELDQFRIVQSGALRILMMMVLVVALIGIGVLFMPVSRWMGLRHISSAAAALTLLFMLLRVVTGWIFGFISNSYMVVGELHRGAVWQNVQRLVAMLAMAAFLWGRASFPVLALTQFASVLLFTLIMVLELRFRAPILVPTLRYGNLRDMLGVLKPSSYYMLYSFGAFLCWQGPILLIQKILGPVAVAVFALSRVIFNMTRQLIIILTQSISQENIELIAGRKWQQLRRMYDLSERVVLFVNAATTVGALLACPLLLRVWLHKSGLYDPAVCTMMAIISAVMALRHHKYTFQYLSNRHEGVARFSVAAYGVMIVFTALTLRPLGIHAYLVSWLVAELLICVYVIRQNQLLFPVEFRPSLSHLGPFTVLLVSSFAAASWPVWHDAAWPLRRVGFVAAATIIILLVAGYYAFGMRELRSVFENRLRRRFAAR